MYTHPGCNTRSFLLSLFHVLRVEFLFYLFFPPKVLGALEYFLFLPLWISSSLRRVFPSYHERYSFSESIQLSTRSMYPRHLCFFFLFFFFAKIPLDARFDTHAHDRCMTVPSRLRTNSWPLSIGSSREQSNSFSIARAIISTARREGRERWGVDFSPECEQRKK